MIFKIFIYSSLYGIISFCSVKNLLPLLVVIMFPKPSLISVTVITVLFSIVYPSAL